MTALVDGLLVVRVSGELDLATADQLRAAITTATEAPHRHLVLDLRRLTFLDSSGVALLMELQRAADLGGPGLAVAPGAGAPSPVLERTGVGGHLTLVDDPAELLRNGWGPQAEAEADPPADPPAPTSA